MGVGSGSRHWTCGRSSSGPIDGGKLGLVDAIVSLLIAVILIYVGAVIVWSLNPLLAVLFVIFALYVAARTVAKGVSDGL